MRSTSKQIAGVRVRMPNLRPAYKHLSLPLSTRSHLLACTSTVVGRMSSRGVINLYILTASDIGFSGVLGSPTYLRLGGETILKTVDQIFAIRAESHQKEKKRLGCMRKCISNIQKKICHKLHSHHHLMQNGDISGRLVKDLQKLKISYHKSYLKIILIGKIK